MPAFYNSQRKSQAMQSELHITNVTLSNNVFRYTKAKRCVSLAEAY